VGCAGSREKRGGGDDDEAGDDGGGGDLKGSERHGVGIGGGGARFRGEGAEGCWEAERGVWRLYCRLGREAHTGEVGVGGKDGRSGAKGRGACIEGAREFRTGTAVTA
jgi:hypothetical protein